MLHGLVYANICLCQYRSASGPVFRIPYIGMFGFQVTQIRGVFGRVAEELVQFVNMSAQTLNAAFSLQSALTQSLLLGKHATAQLNLEPMGRHLNQSWDFKSFQTKSKSVSNNIKFVTLSHGCLILLLDGQRCAEFNSNLPQHTCLDISSNPGDLDKLIQVCLIRVGAQFYRIVALQDQDWTSLPYQMIKILRSWLT